MSTTSASPPTVTVAFPIETQRLTLRPFVDSDLDDLYAYVSLPEVVRYLYSDVRDLDATRTALTRKLDHVALVAEGDRLTLAVVWREVGRVVGEVCLRWASQEHQQGEVGFIFHPQFHGRGLATEAAKVVLDLGFMHFGLHRIYGRCDARNNASARLMSRLGMRQEAHLIHNEFFKGEWGDELIYAILAVEWSANGGYERTQGARGGS